MNTVKLISTIIGTIGIIFGILILVSEGEYSPWINFIGFPIIYGFGKLVTYGLGKNIFVDHNDVN